MKKRFPLTQMMPLYCLYIAIIVIEIIERCSLKEKNTDIDYIKSKYFSYLFYIVLFSVVLNFYLLLR